MIRTRLPPSAIFDTTETFGKNRKRNKLVQWEVEEITLKDSLKNYTSRLESLASEVGEELELFLDQKKMQLSLYEKGSPIMGFAKDSQRINAFLYESRKELEIELNEKTPYAFSWDIIGQNFEPAKARRRAIQNLKQAWKNSQSDGTETGTINGKSIKATLGTNWESDFANKNTREEIGEYEQQLRNKITNLVGSQLIKFTFTKKNIQVEEDNYSEKKRLTLELEEPTDLTFYCHYRKKNLTWNFKRVYFKSEKDSEYYDLLTDEDNQNFEFSFPFSEFFYRLNDINFSQNRNYSVYASESWTPNGTLEINHSREFDNLWNDGKIVLKETDSEKPDPKLENLTSLLDAALSPTATDQDKVAALKKSGEFLGFISPENQVKITEINQQLTNKPTQLRQALSEKIENQLKTNNLTINDLSAEDKTLYNNLKSTSSVQVIQIQAAETKLNQAIGVAGAKKTLDNLETQIRKILSSSDQDEKLKLQKLLRKFIKSNNSFYQAEKSRAQNLNRELKKSIQENDFNQNSEIPWEKITILVGGGIILSLVLAVIFNRLNKRKS